MNFIKLYNSPVPPLKGLRETLTASVSYRASVPAGHAYCEVAPSHRALAPAADRQNRSSKALSGKGSVPATPPPFRHTPFRPRPRHTAPVWRNLGQHPHRDGTFTFSAKEKDLETGLSYFGSRYYNSDLSVWLSVDPMSDKYPSTSPYAYCRNNPIRLIDPNGMFDDEAKATRLRNRAARRYGEDRVSDVFNNTIDGSKPDYAFSIYGKGKTKRSYSGGTNEDGGPIITCDKPDKVVFSRRDFRTYKKNNPRYSNVPTCSNNSRCSADISLTLTAGAQYGTKVDIKGCKIGLMGNFASVDLAASSMEINNDGVSTDNYLINQAYIQGHSGFAMGPIGYNYYSETSFEQTTYSNHSVSAVGFNVYNSNPRGDEISYSFSLAVLLGVRLDLKIKY